MKHRRQAIDRYLLGELGPEPEARLRAHLRACAPCRKYYDQQRLLWRALSGDPDRPTKEEEALVEGLVLGRQAAEPSAGRVFSLAEWLVRLWGDALPLARSFAVAVTLLVVLGTAISMVAIAPAAVGFIERARGTALKGTPAKGGDAVLAGWPIKVSDAGLAVVSASGVGLIRIYPGSEVEFPDRAQELVVSRGKVWCLVTPGQKDFTVRTPESVTLVAGTSFVVERQSDRTAIRVISGAVEVRDANSLRPVRVEQGQGTQVGRGTGPLAPWSLSAPGDEEEWSGTWERLLRQIQRDVRSGVETLEEALR